MTSIAERKAQLTKRLSDLRSRLTGIEAELDQPHSPDWEDQATEREGDQVLESMGISAQQEIRMIDAALERIVEGEYGFCGKCGAKIGEERLNILPFTPFCRDCAA